ncbi:MAG: hypothetical protein ABR584_06405 [Candidatus Baltobacteraceae bacterium]
MLQSNTRFVFTLLLIAMFVVGAGLYAISTALAKLAHSPPVPWPQRIDDSATDLPLEAKIEMIERLGLIGARWCEEILQQADTEEDDPTLRRVIAFALADCRQAAMR